jgi:hypothetical protein
MTTTRTITGTPTRCGPGPAQRGGDGGAIPVAATQIVIH